MSQNLPTAYSPFGGSATTGPSVATRAALTLMTIPVAYDGLHVYVRETGFTLNYTFMLSSALAVNGTSVLATSMGGNTRWVADEAAAVITLAGDVTGPSNANTVVSLTGAAGKVSILAATLAWAAATVSPILTQDNTALTPGNDLTIKAQTSTNGAGVGGKLILQSGAGFNAASSGEVRVLSGASLRFFADGATTFVANGTTVPATGFIRSVYSGAGVPIITSKDSGGTDREVLRYSSADSINLGNNFDNTSVEGFGVTITADSTPLLLNASVIQNQTALGVEVSRFVNNAAAELQFAAADTSVKLWQANTAGAAGATLTLQAQNSTNGAGVGGDLKLQSGVGFNADNNGDIDFFHGASLALSLNAQAGPSLAMDVGPTMALMQIRASAAGQAIYVQSLGAGGFVELDGSIIHVADAAGGIGINLIGGTGSPEIHFTSNAASAKVWQVDTAATPGANLTIAAQTSTNAAGTGGDLILTIGGGITANGNLKLTNLKTAATANAGANVLPATPEGFARVFINGTERKIPYYLV